ncbi:MAG: FtsX-like permease family protein [Polyangia bacterium]
MADLADRGGGVSGVSLGGFASLIAGRYLRVEATTAERRRAVHIAAAMVVCLGLLFALDQAVAHRMKDHLNEVLWTMHNVLRPLKWVWANVTALLIVFAALLAMRLTIFAAISTFGMYLGTGALVTVLSVMSGFEGDLKAKILGTHAHMIVTTPDRSFTDYREALGKVEKVPGVVAATPYLTSEVMIASQSNLAGVIIKGVNPETVGRVTELVKNTDQGSLEYLSKPEKLLELPTGPNFPSVTFTPKASAAGATDGGAGPAGEADAGATDGAVARPDAAAAPTGKAPAKAAAGAAGPARATASAVAAELEDESAPPPPPRPRRERKVLPGVAIGRELAKNLRVYLAEDVNVVSPMGDIGPSGPIPKTKPFRVAATFFSGMYEYDSKYVYMSLAAAQRFLGLGDEVTGLELKLADPEHPEAVMAAAEAALGPGFEVQGWQQTNRSLFAALKLEKIAMFIALCFIILVAAFSIVSNGIMLVLEKGREIAILKSMGAADGAVMRIFVLLGLSMGVVGTALGLIHGCLLCVAFDRLGLPLDTDVYYITKLPVTVDPRELTLVLVSSLLLSLLATLYPAWMAARLRPVEGLR